MPLRPFLDRMLVTAARRPSTFWDRWLITTVTAVVAAVVIVVWDWWGWDRTSVSGARQCALVAFAWVIAVLMMLGLGVVIGEVSPGVALERDKKTIDALLSSRLSSGAIVLGLLGAGLVKSLSCLSVVLPLWVLLVFLGGVDPRLALLAGVGLSTTLLFLGTIAIAASVGARTAQRSLSAAMFLAMTWLVLPIFLILLLPRFWPAVARWVVPAALWWLDSTPLCVVANLVGLVRRASFPGAVLRMVGLQVAGAAVLIAWATWQLRPASRAVYDGEGRAALARLLRRRWGARPACGDDPVLWNEIHSTRGSTVVERVTGRLIVAVLLGFLVYLTSWFAGPAFAELAERGYGALPGTPFLPELHPMARMIANRLGGASLEPAPGQARLEFNIVLRQASALLVMGYVLVVAGISAEGIAVEKERDTWLGLLATPLSGWEILRAKMLGAVWRLRGFALVLLALWSLALLAGALHPLGLLIALAGLAATAWFYTALGTYVSLWAPDRRQATSRVILPAMLPMSGFVLLFLPQGFGSVFLGAGSMVFFHWAALLSYEDVAAATATGAFPQLATVRIATGEGAWSVLAALLIGLAGHLIGAAFLTRAACRGFDAAVDRPRPGLD
jgi:ABC-type Na+ efflux pump permease subunit